MEKTASGAAALQAEELWIFYSLPTVQMPMSDEQWRRKQGSAAAPFTSLAPCRSSVTESFELMLENAGEIRVQTYKDTQAAKRFFRKALRAQKRVPIEITTDKLRSYAAAKRELVPSVPYCQDRYANNRAEVSHKPTREQERLMRGFRSDGHAQRFLSVHGQCDNLFRVGRHQLKAENYRELRSGAFQAWSQVTCA
jgi:putative transposase